MEYILRVARPAALSPVVTVATVIGLTALVARVGDVAPVMAWARVLSF